MQPETVVYHRDGFTISTDPSRLDLDLIHDFLSNHAYWSPGISRALVEKAIKNSLCFGIYANSSAGKYEGQIGFARVITDHATFAYLDDVFILPTVRGLGLSKWLMECILSHPELQGLRRWLLATRDAHGLYAQFGFRPLARPERFMEVIPAPAPRLEQH